MKKTYIAILIVFLSLAWMKVFPQAPISLLPENGDKEKVREDEGNQYQALRLRPIEIPGYSKMPEGPANIREQELLARLDKRTLKGLDRYRELKESAALKQAQRKFKEAQEFNRKAQKKQKKIFDRTGIQFDQPPGRVQLENLRRLAKNPENLDPSSPEAEYLRRNVRDLNLQENQNEGIYGSSPRLESQRESNYEQVQVVENSIYTPGPITTTTTITTTPANKEEEIAKLGEPKPNFLRTPKDKYGPLPPLETNNLISPDDLLGVESIARLLPHLQSFSYHHLQAMVALEVGNDSEFSRQFGLSNQARDQAYQDTGIFFEFPPNDISLESMEEIADAHPKTKMRELESKYNFVSSYFREAITYTHLSSSQKERDDREEEVEK